MSGEEGEVRNGPLSWRDVYHAVERSEDRILERMDEQTDEIKKVLEVHERRIRANEAWISDKDSRSSGSSKVWDTQRVVLVTLLAAGGFAVSLLNFLANEVLAKN